MASLEYLAGLFDGEGTFSLHRQKKVCADGSVSWYAAPLVCITNTDKRLIDAVIGRWGREQIVSHSRLKPYHKDRYTWYASSRNALQVCKDLLPFLLGKREQAYIVSVIAEINKAWKRKYVGTKRRTPEWKLLLHELAIDRIRQLNKRGEA